MAKPQVIVLTDEAQRGIKQMLTTSNGTRDELKRAILSGMLCAKKNVQAVAKRVIGTGYKHSAGDPRDAWKAVKVNAWKRKGIGASIAIMEGNKTETREWNPKRKGTRGRRAISARTRQLNAYYGQSRAFILRFINSGTKQRFTGGRNKRVKGVTKIYHNGGSVANRGKIKASGWFEQSAVPEVNSAAERIGRRFSDRVVTQFEK